MEICSGSNMYGWITAVLQLHELAIKEYNTIIKKEGGDRRGKLLTLNLSCYIGSGKWRQDGTDHHPRWDMQFCPHGKKNKKQPIEICNFYKAVISFQEFN